MNELCNLAPDQADQPNPFLAAAEGYYAGALLDTMHRQGVLRQLKEPHTVNAIAVATGFEASTLGPILAYLSSVADCVVYDAAESTYQTHPAYFLSEMSAHILDQYIGAYGPCLSTLETTADQSLVDRSRHAEAFKNASGAPNDLVQLVLGLTPGCVLDLGCGTAGLLKTLIAADAQIQAIGIDANAAMLTQAMQGLADDGTSNLELICGDVLEQVEALPEQVRDEVDIIIAQSLANEFFGARSMVELLSRLSSALPNRLLIIADYYGCLDTWKPVSLHDQRRGALHDVAQALSGQGIPPGDLNTWQDIYAQNGCVLIKASSIVSGGVHRFIHVVKI